MNGAQRLTLEDTREAAESAGLRYVSEDEKGFSRKKAGRSFAYFDTSGHLIRDEAQRARIRALAIPPAWRDVWICRDGRGHIQATGRDDKGRKQYRYHAKWAEIRDSVKYDHMIEFARGLPAIRAKIDEHMRLRGLPREKVLATIVHLLETTLIRVGNEDYAKTNKSFGLTTLRNTHVDVGGSELKFQFKGKSGKIWNLKIKDRRVARVVKQCQELPGQHLFAYIDDDGTLREVTSADVNDYLRDISGQQITAKDFRTWAGTVLAALALADAEHTDVASRAKKIIKSAIERVAKKLGNTPTICRKCYVHPQVFNAYLQGALHLDVSQTDVKGLDKREAKVLSLLQAASSRHGKETAAYNRSGKA